MTRLGLDAFAVAALLALPSASFAQTGAIQIPELVKTGQTMLVVDDEGRQIQGRIGRITEDTMSLSRRGVTVDVRLDRIVRIERPDGVRNGMLIGFGFGAACGLVSGAFDNQGTGRRGTFMLASTGLTGLIWMAYGAGIDALVHTRRTIYQRAGSTTARLSPIVGRGAGGAAVSLTW